jgi:hypothetical protein
MAKIRLKEGDSCAKSWGESVQNGGNNCTQVLLQERKRQSA